MTHMLLPQEIAEKLAPMEYVDLCTEVERRFKQEFGVVSVKRGSKISVTIELADSTQRIINL